MTSRIKFSPIVLACLACVVFLLSGCATVTQETDPPLLLSRSHFLKDESTPSADNVKLAGQPALGNANVKLGPARESELRSPVNLPIVEIPTIYQLPLTIDLTHETDDLLQRIRNGFSMPDINNDLVLYHQQWFLNRPDYLRRMVERSSRYLHYVVEELDKRGMPMEIALLPMVESAYNPMAYSRAKASGLWQFIPSTGKRYNLDQNWWKDDRRDIVASTVAALDYLQSIYELHGDWHLALASYNWGEGAVGRAINKNRALGLPTDYQSLTMPGETKNYVPKLQALKNIFSSPALLAELNLLKIPNRAYFGTVTKTANIDVKVAAKLAGMPVQDFVALNPSHNRPVIKSDSAMVIPADKMDAFMNNLEAHEGSNKPLSSWQAYTMRPGDKLEKIAPRFGMTVANLKEANGIKGRIKVSPGFTLLVAAHGGADSATMAPLPEQPRLPVADPEARSSTRSHTVRKGETLPLIARRYSTTVAELKRINHLRSDKIAVGRRLTLAEAGRPTLGQKKAPRITHYTIRRGDTLSSIAKRFKVGKDDLLRWNRISPNALIPGKTLTIQVAQNP
ncbi:LysM peptidoglycan-binding domain-containing protein [Propionivibrio sp.]|uniref:LysM peptidoglycan-binding domain-containing protein n=1 Tax=Propionivibrio sp. TaxID=2212460 RepID=UPI002631CCFC|nr:LysM peptidoglycan-binding domain-containing protein [Propionivibrio sp.]